MKVSRKTGKIRLDANEVMVDENRYFVKREFGHMKLYDMNYSLHVSVSRRTVAGAWLENMWVRATNGEEEATRTLKTYMATLWSVLTVAPDDAFINDTLEAVDGAFNRHPDWYGLDNDSKDEPEVQDRVTE